MAVETCTNKACGKQFQVTFIAACGLGGNEPVPVICPHCQTVVRQEAVRGAFKTTPVTEKTT